MVAARYHGVVKIVELAPCRCRRPVFLDDPPSYAGWNFYVILDRYDHSGDCRTCCKSYGVCPFLVLFIFSPLLVSREKNDPGGEKVPRIIILDVKL